MPQSGGGPDHFTVPIVAFERMLDTIAKSGYLGCSLSDAMANPGQPRVAITFDDGTRGQFDHAFPALVARGMTATFYVTTDWIGRDGFMTWSQLRQMVAAGMSVQSHTCSHPFLSELGPDQLLAELTTSKRVLDRELGQNTQEIAFPGGDAPIRPLQRLMKQAGYEVAVGSRWGSNHDKTAADALRVFVRRCSMRGGIDAETAQRIVEGDVWLSVRTTTKEATLRRLRSSLGASRYARLRRLFLDSVAGKTTS